MPNQYSKSLLFSENEIKIIKERYGGILAKDLAKLLTNKTASQVIKKANKLGLKANKTIIYNNRHVDFGIWEDKKLVKQLKMLVPELGYKKTAKILNISVSSVSHKAVRLGIKSKNKNKNISNAVKKHWQDLEITTKRVNSIKKTKNTEESKKLSRELWFRKYETGAIVYNENLLEKKVRNKLELLKIKFEQQKIIDNFIIDFYIPDFNLCIEVNGNYWHSNPNIYPKPKNQAQIKNTERDKIKYTKLIQLNYKILVVWESYINNDKNNLLPIDFNFENNFKELL